MNRFGLAVLVLCGLVTGSHGQDKKAIYTQAVNHFAHESLVCGVYLTISAQCTENRGDRESITFANQLRKLSEIAMKDANDTGNLIGTTEKAQLARLQMAMQDLRADINDNCANISVLLQKYGQSCKRVVDTGMEDLAKQVDSIMGK